jgi:hypothetical protein
MSAYRQNGDRLCNKKSGVRFVPKGWTVEKSCGIFDTWQLLVPRAKRRRDRAYGRSSLGARDSCRVIE